MSGDNQVALSRPSSVGRAKLISVWNHSVNGTNTSTLRERKVMQAETTNTSLSRLDRGRHDTGGYAVAAEQRLSVLHELRRRWHGRQWERAEWR